MAEAPLSPDEEAGVRAPTAGEHERKLQGVRPRHGACPGTPHAGAGVQPVAQGGSRSGGDWAQ